MVTHRRRRRATKQEQATQSQDGSQHMMPTLVKTSPPTNSGIMVLPSLSRDPYLVQAMQQCLSNHSLLSRRCHRPKSKGYPRKLHKLLTVKPFQRRKEAGKMPPIDSRSWRTLNPSATGNPYMSGRSGHSLKPFERSRGSSRSRHSSSFYPSTWQLEDDSIKKNEKIIDSKNSLEEIIHCACLNRTSYDHRLNVPLKTDTACQCRLKRSREKAIQMPSTRIRSRTSCKLKRLKHLISKHLFSVVAQQTQTSLKSNSHEGKVSSLGNSSLHQCRAYSGEEDNSKNTNKKVAKFKNYGGYSPSETSFEDSQERPAEHLSRIEKISKPPQRRPSDPPRIQRENSGRHMDCDIQGPPWSLHLANVKEIERYAARSADCDYCETVCPKRDICQCEYEDYYDEYDNDEDYNDNDEKYNDYDNDGDGDAEEDGIADGDGDANDWASKSVIVENSEKGQEDENSTNTQEDLDDNEDAEVVEEVAPVNKDSRVDVDDKKDENKDSSHQRDSSKTKKWKNVGFCPDVTCNRKCGHCSKVQRETECNCENSVRGRNGGPPRYTNRSICKCCQCSRTPSSNRLNRDNRGFCPAAKCDRKCRRCREVMTQTSKEVLTKELPSEEQDVKSTNTKKQSTNLKSNRSSQLNTNNVPRESPRHTKSSRKTVSTDKQRTTDSQQSLDNGSQNFGKTDQRNSYESPKKMESQSREGSQRSVDNRSTNSRRSPANDQRRSRDSPTKMESQLREGSQRSVDNRSTTSRRSVKTDQGRSRDSPRRIESQSKEASQGSVDNRSTNSRRSPASDQRRSRDSPTKMESQSREGSQRSVDNRSTTSRRSVKTDQGRSRDSPRRIESQSKEESQGSLDNRSTNSRRSSANDQRRSRDSPKKIESQSKEGSPQDTGSRRSSITETRRSPDLSKEGSQRSMDTKATDSRDYRNRKSKTVEVEEDISFTKNRDRSSSDDQSKRKESRRNSKSGEGLLESSISRHGGRKENTSKLSTRESLGEVPVNVENYASEDVKRDAPDKKHCGDSKCFSQCRPCSEAVTQTYFSPEFMLRCYCPCAEAVTQTSYRCLCCRRCGVAMGRARCGPCGPRRKESGTEASTFSGKYSPISKYLPDKFCYCTENRKHSYKSMFNKFTNHSRRSSIDRRYRQTELQHFPNYPKAYHCGDKSCTPSHLQAECNYPSVAIGSQSDLKQIIDILHKAVNGLELQQNTKEEMPPRSGARGGRDVPLSNQGSYADYQQPQQPCIKDSGPLNHPHYANQKMQPHYCQDNKACPLNVQLYALNEYSEQQSINQNLGKPIRKSQREDRSLPLSIPKVPSPNYKDQRFNTQDRRSQDPTLSSSNPELKSPRFKNLNTQGKNSNDRYPLLHLTKLPGLMSFQTNKDDQGLPAKYSRHIEDINHKDRMSKQDQASIYQSSAADDPNYTKRQSSDPNIMPNGNSNIEGQTLYYKGQILSSTKPDVKGRKSLYPPLNQNYQSQMSPISYQDQREERRTMPTRRQSGQAIQNPQDSSNMYHLRPVRFQVSEPIYQRDPSSLHEERIFSTSQGLDETKPQLYSANDCIEDVKFTHPFGLNEPFNPTMQRYNEYPEYCQDKREYKTKTHQEYICDKSPCPQKLYHHLQASNSSCRVGLTDPQVPMDNKLRKISGQSGDFLNDEQSHMMQMQLPNGQRSNLSPKIQSKWPQTCNPINTLNGNSFLINQHFWPSKDTDNRNQMITRDFLPNCESNPGIVPIWPQPKKLQGRNSTIALNKSSFLTEQNCWSSEKPGKNSILNCDCKNREDIPTTPVSRFKHTNSNVALSRLSSYDKHILRDFEKSKRVPQPTSEKSKKVRQPTSEEASSDCECEEPPKCPCSDQRNPSPACLCSGCMEKLKRENEHIHYDAEPKTSKVQFTCCKMPKREKKEAPKQVEPKKERREKPRKVETKPSRGLFACCKKEKGDKKMEPKTTREKEKKETEKKPSRGIFSCCKKREKEKKETSKEVESKPSKGLFPCCKKSKKEKKEIPKENEPKAKSSKNLFACCKRPKKEKEEKLKDTEPKARSSKNIFACCKRPKKEKEETPKDAKPKSKPSKNLFSCCILSKKEKKEAYKDAESKASKKEKKETSKDVKPKRSCSFTPCWKGEKSENEKPEPPPKPPRTGNIYDEEIECPCPKPRQVEEVKVLFDCSSRFCDCSSEEEVTICYNPRTRQIPDHEGHNYVICNKLESPPIYTCCRPPTRSVESYESTSSNSSCDCDSSADSSDENDDESQNANHFYNIFTTQNSNNTNCNCNLRRR